VHADGREGCCDSASYLTIEREGRAGDSVLQDLERVHLDADISWSPTVLPIEETAVVEGSHPAPLTLPSHNEPLKRGCPIPGWRLPPRTSSLAVERLLDRIPVLSGDVSVVMIVGD